MATILKTKSVYFTDVNIIPRPGIVESRKDVIDEKHLIIVSPMAAVVGESFTKEAAKSGLSLTIPRFIDEDKKIKLYSLFQQNKINSNQLCFMSVGMNESPDDLLRLNPIKPENWLIDVASGYVPQWKKSVNRLCDLLQNRIVNLMVGNVVTGEGVRYLENNLQGFANQLFIRIGIGNGKNCKTSDVTGINRGQITELIECSNEAKSSFLVSDGGIDRGGFCIKAWGAGASYVLMGEVFSKALEAETNISGDGTYFGCASDKQNKLAGLDKHSEGKVTTVNTSELKPLSAIVKELWGGISSGISYVGYKSVLELVGRGIFEEKCNSLPPKIRY